MGKNRTCDLEDAIKAMDYIDNLPNQKAAEFSVECGDAGGSESRNYAMLDDEFTLIEIKRFLDSHGFSTTIDELRRLRRFNGIRDANSDPVF